MAANLLKIAPQGADSFDLWIDRARHRVVRTVAAGGSGIAMRRAVPLHAVAAAAGAIFATACLSAAESRVPIIGNRKEGSAVLHLVRAAETRDEPRFRDLTARSLLNEDGGPAIEPPRIEEVDRRDEGCVLRSIDASVPRLVEAFWSCRENSKPNVARMFIVERGRVTHMWNDAADPGLD